MSVVVGAASVIYSCIRPRPRPVRGGRARSFISFTYLDVFRFVSGMGVTCLSARCSRFAPSEFTSGILSEFEQLGAITLGSGKVGRLLSAVLLKEKQSESPCMIALS